MDMTQGKPGRLILGFALPLMLGNVFQQLYTFVDTLVVGQALGVNALAALGASEWLTFLMFGSVQGLTQGFSVIISQKFGAGQEGELRRAVFQAALLSAVAAVLLTGLGQAALPAVLSLMGTPEEIRGMTLLYLRFIYAGIPAALLYNTSAAILRAVGDSRTPLRAMTVSSVCNIVLDLLFVLVLGMGIPGAAVSTVLAQVLSGICCLAGISRIPGLHMRREDCRADRELIVQQLRLGLPLCLQNMITSFGGLVVQSVINGFGVLFIAGYTAANKLYGLLEIAASSYGYAMSSYAGQNMGAGKRERIGAGLRAGDGGRRLSHAFQRGPADHARWLRSVSDPRDWRKRRILWRDHGLDGSGPAAGGEIFLSGAKRTAASVRVKSGIETLTVPYLVSRMQSDRETALRAYSVHCQAAASCSECGN